MGRSVVVLENAKRFAGVGGFGLIWAGERCVHNNRLL